MTSRDDARLGFPDFLTDGGELGALMRAHDWSASPLGAPEAWPQSLRTTVRLLLNTGHPMYVWWGPDLLCFYNDAYRQSIGPERHPSSLGQPAREVWAEIWDIIGPQIDHVMSGGGASWCENQLVPITRNGAREEVYWTYSYGPIDDENSPDGVGGVLVVCSETTQAVLAERRAAEIQEHQRQMLRQMPGFVGMLTGPDLIYTYVNDAYATISERTDFVGRRFRDVFADIEGQGYFEVFEDAFRNGKGVVTRGMELRLHGREDKQFVDFVLEPIRDGAGEVTGLFVGGYETTEVYRGNEALRQSEARLGFLDRLGAETAALAEADAVLATTTRLLGEHLNLSVCAYADMDEDEDGFTIRGDWAAPGSTSIVGHYSLADFGKLAVKNLGAGLPLVVNDNRKELAPEEAATFQNIGIAATICMPLVKDGRLTALMAIHDCIPRIWTDAELSLLREVTARSWAHVERVAVIADLRESEARLRALNADLERQVTERALARGRTWQVSPDILGVVDATGCFILSNPAWGQVLGWTEGEVARTPFIDLVHPDDVARTRELYAVLLKGDPVLKIENRYRAKNGSYRWLSWVAVPDEGRIYCSARDVTVEKEQAEALAHAEEALRQSQKMEAMGQLTGGVAHDFNNLLTPIVGSLDMLQRKGVGGEREQRLIAGALQSADRAKTLVQRLLAFARRQPLQATAVDVNALVTGMADLVASTSGPQIKVVVEGANNLPLAKADANQLEMALLNLGVNARDAMPDGGTLRITAAAESVGAGHRSKLRPGEYLRLSVADTGVGMDEATQYRAVEPFFSTKGVGKGTGLGLSMVHGLALQLGGALTIDSRLGVGTTVELWLPVSEASTQVAKTLAATTPMPAAKGTVLLVDDEELVRMSTADMLDDMGYAVVGAASAEEALQLLDDGLKPDLLLTDHLMPGMNGTDLARVVKSIHPAIQILIVSGYAEGEGIDVELPRLTKPFRSVDLTTMLSQLTSFEQPGSAGTCD